MKKFLKTFIAAIALAGASLALTGCQNNDEQDDDARLMYEDAAVATVNGSTIYRSEVAVEIGQALHMFTSGLAGFDGQYFEQAVLGQALEIAVFNRFALEIAYELGIRLSEEEEDLINDHVQTLQDSHGDDFYNLLYGDGFISAAHLITFIQNQRILEHFHNQLVFGEADFTRFEPYVLPMPEYEILAAKHILTHFGEFETEEEAYERAVMLLERALLGEDFDQLIVTYGHDPGMAHNPNGYTFTQGAMIPAFEDATRQLEIGEISGIVRGSSGYHIILRVEPIEENLMFPLGYRPPTLSELRSEAIFYGITAMVQRADIVHLPALFEIPVN